MSPAETFAVGSLAAAAGIAGLVWATGQLAARTTSGRWLDLSAADLPGVLVALAQEPERPAAAFGSPDLLPGPFVFWALAAALLLVPLLATVGLFRARTRARKDDDGPEPARWATPKDLKPLIVRRPTPGRITLGKAHGKLLAAEAGHSLLVMGPTQSGKTSGLAIPAIRDWPGPVLATSVKTDLLDDTLAARTPKGEVWVYDPTSTVDTIPTASWSPLTGCHTWQGALRTATWLTDAARHEGPGDADFWLANAAKLLAPLLYAAATSGRTIADVVRWVDTQEAKEPRLELEAAGTPEAITALEASLGREERARSSVYTTAETVLRAFADPQVADTATTCDIDPQRLLDGGAHSLYVSAPLHEQERLRPLFTALIQTVLTTAYQHAADHGPIDPPLLVVLDEAANIAPLRDLPQLASTAAGLGVQLVTVWQDKAQIATRYREAAATVVNNHRAKLLLSGIHDRATTDELVATLGETEVTRTTTSTNPGGQSTSEGQQLRPLATAATLRQARSFEGVLLYGALPPTQVELQPPGSTVAGCSLPALSKPSGASPGPQEPRA